MHPGGSLTPLFLSYLILIFLENLTHFSGVLIFSRGLNNILRWEYVVIKIRPKLNLLIFGTENSTYISLFLHLPPPHSPPQAHTRTRRTYTHAQLAGMRRVRLLNA